MRFIQPDTIHKHVGNLHKRVDRLEKRQAVNAKFGYAFAKFDPVGQTIPVGSGVFLQGSWFNADDYTDKDLLWFDRSGGDLVLNYAGGGLIEVVTSAFWLAPQVGMVVTTYDLAGDFTRHDSFIIDGSGPFVPSGGTATHMDIAHLRASGGSGASKFKAGHTDSIDRGLSDLYIIAKGWFHAAFYPNSF